MLAVPQIFSQDHRGPALGRQCIGIGLFPVQQVTGPAQVDLETRGHRHRSHRGQAHNKQRRDQRHTALPGCPGLRLAHCVRPRSHSSSESSAGISGVAPGVASGDSPGDVSGDVSGGSKDGKSVATT